MIWKAKKKLQQTVFSCLVFTNWPGLSPPPSLSWWSPGCFPATPFARSHWRLLLDTPGWQCKPSNLRTQTGCSANAQQKFFSKANNTNLEDWGASRWWRYSTLVFVTLWVALQGYLNVVAIDVIWAHNIGISVLQDDPGVVDLSWWERERERKQDAFDDLAL